MVYVKGNSNSAIANLTELGLSPDPIQVVPTFRHKDIKVNAWGEVPAEVQFMLAELNMSMTLVNYDEPQLRECLRLSMGGASAEGQFPGAGALMGGNVARFAPGNNYIGLNFASPVGNVPWRFFFSYLSGTPVTIPLGTEKSIVRLTWRVVPYVQDPWNSGQGSAGYTLWSHVLDT